MRLIDAETLAQEIASLRVTVAGRPATWDEAKNDVLRVIYEQKTVVSVQVVHGRWWLDHKKANPFYILGECSICGYAQSISNELNYCPNCGARMDGGDGIVK